MIWEEKQKIDIIPPLQEYLSYIDKSSVQPPDFDRHTVLHALTSPSVDAVALFEEIIIHGMLGEDSRTTRRIDKEEILSYSNGTICNIPSLIEYVTGRRSDQLKKSRWIIHLPTDKDIYITSDYFPEKPGQKYKKFTLVPYTVPVILCPFDLFLLFYQNRSVIDGYQIILGDSLTYFFSLFDAAIRLTARGRFRPDIIRSGSQYNVCWVPALSPVEISWLNEYSELLPPLCSFALSRKTKQRKIADNRTRVNLCLTRMMQVLIKQALTMYPPVIRPGKRMRDEERDQLSFFSELTGKDLDVQGHQIDKTFIKEMTRWFNSFQKDQSTQKFNICIMLKEPPVDCDYPWTLVLNMRSLNDPSLIIPAEMIWKIHDLENSILPPASYLRQELLTGLGKALATSDVIKKHLSGNKPHSAECSSEDAAAFLLNDAPLLQDKGITLLLPAWWTEKKVRPRVNLKAWKKINKDIPSMFNMATLISFDYRIALGDDSISPEAFKKAADLKMPFVRVGGRWVSYDSESVKEAINIIEKRFIHGKPTARDLIQLSLTSETDNHVLSVQPIDSWTFDLLSITKRGDQIPSVNIPSSFKGVLRKYQEEGVYFLVHCTERGFGACLADDMGLGKTPQTIAWILWLKENKKPETPFLLISPMSVAGNWERELHRFAPSLKVWIHHGSSRIKGDGFIACIKDYDILITTYQLSARDLMIFSHVIWAGIILDEAQNIKNSFTNQTKAIKQLLSERKVALTGTPVENRLVELWSIMDFLNPGYLGSQHAFQSRYTASIEQDNNTETIAELRTLIKPFLIRRLKTDPTVITDLPDKMETKIYCSLTKEQATLYQAVVDDMSRTLDTITGIARKGSILAGITKLKQICNHPGLLARDAAIKPERSGKVRRLMEMLEEVSDEGDSALVFSQYATFARELAGIIRNKFSFPVLLLTGSTTRKEREHLISAFQTGTGPRVFVISLKAGGTGLNLTAATHVFHIDRWWNPAVENQATDRTYRIGQKRNVQVHLMIAAGTLEEKIDEMITRKQSLAEGVLTTGEEFLTSLSTRDLMNIVTLRDEIFSGEDM